MHKGVSQLVITGALFDAAFVSQCSAGAGPDERDIQVFTELKGTEAGLLVKATTPVWISGPNEGRFQLLISNALEEEVFLVVQPVFDEVGFIASKETAESSLFVGGGGVEYSSDDNRFLLRRLSGSWVREGCRVGIDTGLTWIDCRLGKSEVPLKDLIGADAKAQITIRGFFRKDGKAFWKHVDVPIVFSEPPKSKEESQKAKRPEGTPGKSPSSNPSQVPGAPHP